MNRLCLLTVIVSVVCAIPVDNVKNPTKTLEKDDIIKNKTKIIDKDATILNFDSQREKNGDYAYSFDTSNDISRSERWYLTKSEGSSKEYIAVQGQYSYLDPDGKRIVVLYSADENGYVILDSQNDLDDRFGAPTPQVLATLLGG